MTADDLRSQVAAIRASLTHIEAQLTRQTDETSAHRDKTDATLSDISGRVRVVENRLDADRDLPKRVAHNEQENAVQNAMRESAAQLIAQIRLWVFGGLAAVVTIQAILSYMTNG